MVHGNWPGSATVLQATSLGTCAGQQVNNVWHFVAPAANEAAFASDADRITWAEGFLTDWNLNVKTSWLGTHTSDWSLTEVRAQVIEVPGQFEHRLTPSSYTTGLPTAGTLGGAVSEDLTAACVVKWRTAVASRHTRGRSYVGPLEAGGMQAGRLVSPSSFDTALRAWVTAMARYINAGAGVAAGFQQCVYSRPYSAPAGAYVRRIGGMLTVENASANYNGAATAVTSAVVDTVLRSQRRREIGVGS